MYDIIVTLKLLASAQVPETATEWNYFSLVTKTATEWNYFSLVTESLLKCVFNIDWGEAPKLGRFFKR